MEFAYNGTLHDSYAENNFETYDLNGNKIKFTECEKKGGKYYYWNDSNLVKMVDTNTTTVYIFNG